MRRGGPVPLDAIEWLRAIRANLPDRGGMLPSEIDLLKTRLRTLELLVERDAHTHRTHQAVHERITDELTQQLQATASNVVPLHQRRDAVPVVG